MPAATDRTPAKRKPGWPTDRIEYCAVSELVPYARNARTHTDEQVAQIAGSIKEWGFTTPILRDEEGMVIAGHGRLMAAQRLGLDEVPVVTATGWSDAKKRAYVIADNKLAENSGWDYELLSTELEELQVLDYDLGLTGFTDGELSNLLNAEWEPPSEDALPGDEDDEDDTPAGHNIHLDADEATRWRQALDRLRDAIEDPDLSEAQALLQLADAYLDSMA